LKATNNAIPTAFVVADIIRRRIKGISLITKITSTTVEDKFEPKVEGLDSLVIKRVLCLLEIKLINRAAT